MPVILVPAGVMALNPERDLTIESIQKTITVSVDQNPERKISVQNRYTMPILCVDRRVKEQNPARRYGSIRPGP